MDIETRVVKATEGSPRSPELLEAAKCLQSGGLVVFPTETVYGLGANALLPDAVSRVFRVKGRPADNPVIVHISDMGMIRKVASSVPETAIRLMERFWPGPLTLIMQKSDNVPDIVTAGLQSVSIRMPSHAVALALISEAGVPVAAPSANISGRTSITSATEALKELHGMVDFIIDSGRTRIGLESTVLDVRRTPPEILRPGGVTLESLRDTIGEVIVHPAVFDRDYGSSVSLPSPGMKYTHYAPQHAVLVLVEPGPGSEDAINRLYAEYRAEHKRVALLITDECAAKGEMTVRIGSRTDAAGIASRLYAAMRELDDSGADVIIAEGITEKEMGMAVMNRLRRAAGRIESQNSGHKAKNDEGDEP